jgi:exonuclease III
MKALKIATFNINGIRSRLPALLAWLEQEQPDIACLQELKAADQQFPRAELEAAGYGSLHHGQPSWNGVAILVRAPIRSRFAVACPAWKRTARAAIWKLRHTGCWSLASTCRTETRSPGPSSITSCTGSNA